MEYSTLIDRILGAEQSAQRIAGEAEQRQANLEAELAGERERIQAHSMAQAEQRLEKLRQAAQAEKERSLAAQDARRAEASAKIERAYARYGDNWVDTLFHQVVDIR